MNMIEVSFNSQGQPRSCWVCTDALERMAGSGCVSMHTADGARILQRWEGERDYHTALLNVKNIIARGSPRLPDGWQTTTQAAYDAFWKEFTAKV